ncbi:MAG: molybdenum ABC transporter ATP-binding protein [Sulfuricellaceae bacterium]|nr:molybdenum ABC transporter ATP-binding protein [Sulfuricellaceae bacterium]
MSAIHARFRLPLADFQLDVDLNVPGRGVTALFGHSGSGKTTLLRCLAGLERAPDGLLQVNGETWQDGGRGIFLPTHARPLGYVFQEASLFAHLSVRRNLEYGWRRIPAGQRKVDWDQAVSLLGIEPLLTRSVSRLSGGERQRVAIARALLTSPKLLLMDEPLASLDPSSKAEILPYLERLHRELSIPLIYVSHSPDEVARLADYLVLIRNGRAAAAGPLLETLARVDLPVFGDDAGIVFDTLVAEHDTNYHLSRVEFPGGGIWVRDANDPVGSPARVRILARDVSLTLERQHDTSILNILPATVLEIGDGAHPSQALVKLDAGGVPLLSRLTRRSLDALKLAPGLAVWAQIKAVALLR